MACNIGSAPALARRRRIPAARQNPSDYGLKAIERTNETIQSHASQSLSWQPRAKRRSLPGEYAITVNRTRFGSADPPPGPSICQYIAAMTSRAAQKVVEIYTDGACSGNPGPGGWGAVLSYDGREKDLFGGEATGTTNNRMELMAAIQALESLTRPSTVRLHTDSSYVRNGITTWLPGWKRNGWKTASKQPVKNADLWQRLDAAAARHDVLWLWVKGHAGNPGNERADALANRGMEEARARPSLK